MKRADWNQRYRASDLVWGSGPNRFVAEAFGEVPARGRALDLACGEGRNAIWLATRGWSVTGVDFAGAALERAARLAAEAEARVVWIEADVVEWEPEPGGFELVLISYLQIPSAPLRAVLAHAVDALAPGGELFGIGHAVRNLEEGVGGPQDARVLWDPEVLEAWLSELGLTVEVCEHVHRPVELEGGARDAIDVRVRAFSPSG